MKLKIANKADEDSLHQKNQKELDKVGCHLHTEVNVMLKITLDLQMI